MQECRSARAARSRGLHAALAGASSNWQHSRGMRRNVIPTWECDRGLCQGVAVKRVWLGSILALVWTCFHELSCEKPVYTRLVWSVMQLSQCASLSKGTHQQRVHPCPGSYDGSISSAGRGYSGGEVSLVRSGGLASAVASHHAARHCQRICSSPGMAPTGRSPVKAAAQGVMPHAQAHMQAVQRHQARWYAQAAGSAAMGLPIPTGSGAASAGLAPGGSPGCCSGCHALTV
jgi:hypothetical protein